MVLRQAREDGKGVREGLFRLAKAGRVQVKQAALQVGVAQVRLIVRGGRVAGGKVLEEDEGLPVEFERFRVRADFPADERQAAEGFSALRLQARLVRLLLRELLVKRQGGLQQPF